MGRTAAAIGSVIFFILAPGVVAYLVPFLLAQTQAESWQLDPPVVKWAGLALGLAGTIALIECFARFAWKGIGTPAPIAPTEHLVVTGLYRHVRNPMYVAVLAIILAHAMWFASLAILIYAAIIWASFTAFVMLYEEPTLARTFGAEYAAYRANVGRWIPRLVPWNASPQRHPRRSRNGEHDPDAEDFRPDAGRDRSPGGGGRALPRGFAPRERPFRIGRFQAIGARAPR